MRGGSGPAGERRAQPQPLARRGDGAHERTSAVGVPSGGGRDGGVDVTKVNTEACATVHSSFLGGSEQDRTGGDKGDPAGNPIAVDAEGCAYVTGRTKSTDFPTTAGAFQGAFGGPDADGFVARICPGPTVYLPVVLK